MELTNKSKRKEYGIARSWGKQSSFGAQQIITKLKPKKVSSLQIADKIIEMVIEAYDDDAWIKDFPKSQEKLHRSVAKQVERYRI